MFASGLLLMSLHTCLVSGDAVIVIPLGLTRWYLLSGAGCARMF